MTNPVRILLSETASRHLTETGERAFIVIGKASYPEDPKRWVIHLLPASIAQADAAVRVARGEARAVRIKQSHLTESKHDY